MIVHLQYHHRSEFDKVKMKCNLVQPVVQKPEGQRSITDAFQHLQPLPQSSQKWKSLTNSVCYCIAKDMMPFSAVSNKGFQNMLHAFEPRYVLPDRKTIYHTALYARYVPERKDENHKGNGEGFDIYFNYYRWLDIPCKP